MSRKTILNLGYPKQKKMNITTGCQAFDRQTSQIHWGNANEQTQYSRYIDAWIQRDKYGTFHEPGYLLNEDLDTFTDLPPQIREEVTQLLKDRDGILYKFFHRSGHKIIVDGWILTDGMFRPIKTWVTGPTAKSRGIIETVQKYIMPNNKNES